MKIFSCSFISCVCFWRKAEICNSRQLYKILGNHSILATFIGFTERSKSFMVLDPERHSVLVSQYALLDEIVDWFLGLNLSGSTGCTDHQTRKFEASQGSYSSGSEDGNELTTRTLGSGQKNHYRRGWWNWSKHVICVQFKNITAQDGPPMTFTKCTAPLF